MTDVVDGIMAIWREMPADDAEAHAAVARYYADPVVVNGSELGIGDLVARARSLQRALTDIRHELVERVEAGDQLVIAFVIRGRHTGPLSTAIGEVPATGQEVAIQGMDVLTFTGGRISKITVLADELGLLARLDAVSLR
jgi:predicted ester cyclase